jgi:hypothetical protein
VIRALLAWVGHAARSLALNVFGFLLIFGFAGVLAIGVRAGLEKALAWGPIWPALVFTVAAAAAWGTVFGLLTKEWIRNPDRKVLPGPAVGVVLAGAAVWIYIFAAFSYVLARQGAVHYDAPGVPEDLLYKLTDAYAWYFIDLLPGLNVTSALGWKSPVDLQGGLRGALLVLFRAAVIFQVFAKGHELLKRDEDER